MGGAKRWDKDFQVSAFHTGLTESCVMGFWSTVVCRVYWEFTAFHWGSSFEVGV